MRQNIRKGDKATKNRLLLFPSGFLVASNRNQFWLSEAEREFIKTILSSYQKWKKGWLTKFRAMHTTFRIQQGHRAIIYQYQIVKFTLSKQLALDKGQYPTVTTAISPQSPWNCENCLESDYLWLYLYNMTIRLMKPELLFLS